MKKKQSDRLSEEVLLHYLNLDDSDIIQLLKSWEKQSDQVLASLSSQLLNRKLPRIKIRDKAYNRDEINDKTSSLDAAKTNLKASEYFVFSGSISNQTYLSDESQLLILEKNGNIFPIAEAIQYLDFKQFSTPVTKYYLCYPKQINSL